MDPGTLLLDRYEVVRELGAGGAGELLLVRDRRNNGAPCALKILRPRVPDPGLAPLFRNEFLLLSEVRHECIVRVQDFGVLESGEPFFTMDYVSGESCRLFVEEDRLEAAEYVDLAAGLLGALSHVHARGILHRDVKPENVIMRRHEGRLRPVLVDFGLAVSAAAARAGEAGGTLPYIAPEVVAGAAADERSDLFALGMLLFEVCVGKPPAKKEALLRSPARHLAAERVRSAIKKRARGSVPRRFEDFLVRLLEPTPAGRYPTAPDALRALADLYGESLVGTPLEVTVRPGLSGVPLVGRGDVLDGLLKRLDALRAGDLLDPIAVVAGRAGMGATRLLAALRNHAAAAGNTVVSGATLRELTVDLGSHPALGGDLPEPTESPAQLVFRIDSMLRAAPQSETPLLILDDVHALRPAEAEALRQWMAAMEEAEGRARFLLVLGGRNEGEGPGVEILRTAGRNVPVEWRDLAPLEPKDVRAALAVVLGRPRIPAAVVQSLHRASGGSPLVFGELLRFLVAEGILDFDGEEPVLDAGRLKEVALPEGVAEATRARAAHLGKQAAAVLARLALVEGELSFGAARAVAGELLGPLVREGFLRRDRGRIRFAHELVRQAADVLEGAGRKGALKETAAALEEEDPAVAARLLAAAGELERARAIGHPAARALLEERRLEDALRLLEALAGGDPDQTTLGLLQRVYYEHGRARDSARAGRALLESGSDDVDTLLLTCSALNESGRQEEALRLLQERDPSGAGEASARVANAKAGLLDSLGRREEALLESSRAEAAAGSLLGAGGRIARVRANIFRHQGRLSASERLETLLIESPGVEPQFKLSAHINRASILRRRGEILAAIRDLRAVLAWSRRAARILAQSRALSALAWICISLGRHGRAARLLEASRKLLARSARVTELKRILLLEAWALALSGRPTEAELRLKRALALPGESAREQATFVLVRAMLCHYGGDSAAGAAALEGLLADGRVDTDAAVFLARITAAVSDVEAAEEAWRAVLRHLRAERERSALAAVRVGLAECAAERRAWRLAERILERGAGSLLDLKTPERARALLVRAGAALSRRRPGPAARHLQAAIAVANRTDDAPLRAEVYAAAASFLEEGELQRYLRQPTAAACAELLEAARDIWSHYGNETMLRKIDLHLSELPRPAEDAFGGPDADRLVKVLHITREMNREFDRDRLLSLILDRAIELTGAERGFVILLKEGREEVHLARNFDRETLSEPENKISTQIVKEVVHTGRIIRTEDAGTDGRFADSVSVRQLRLRSIMAVPFRSHGKSVGALYLDNRFRPGSFTEREERLLELFADQAVTAIDKAELIRELEGKTRELEQLSRQQKEQLRRRARELNSAKQEIGRHRRARGWSFDRMVARSVAMQAVVREAKRYAASDISVLLTGENGTGKELLARAIHYGSRRQSMPFQALNCAAFPEALLEAELFGHVRGSFTGADRDRAGIFEEADGGTVLLDEVGDMAPPMQVRLLRTLELGEVKRVGESRVRSVDVRVIAATNADLEELIKNGAFREDLYYRLSGVVLRIPPLRERLEDVEPLAYHFVEEAARVEGRLDLSLANDAVAKLESYNWPGNVRELRNCIMRAAVSAQSDVIGPDDIVFDLRSPTILPGFDATQAELVLKELADRGYELNARQRTGLLRALTRGKLTFSEYRHHFRVSKSTTSRDLDGLLEQELLERRGKTRAVLYLPGPSLREAAKKALGG